MADRTSAAGFTRDGLPRQVRPEAPRTRSVPPPSSDETIGVEFLDGWPGWRRALASVAIALALVLFGLALCALAEACG